jgi:hypothetical protein
VCGPVDEVRDLAGAHVTRELTEEEQETFAVEG